MARNDLFFTLGKFFAFSDGVVNNNLMLSSVFSDIYDFILPAICVLCGAKTGRKMNLCLACENDLPRFKYACWQCGLPLVSDRVNRCGQCIQKPPPFNRTLALCSYEKPIAALIMSIKFQQNLCYTKLLGNLLASHVAQQYQHEPLPECIIPVPLYKKRLGKRGFNQALEIARPIAKQLQLAMPYKTCRRVKATKAQAETPAKQRANNVKDAFIVSTLSAKHVAIVDDVITTGHTVAEVTRALRRVGVKTN